MGVLGTERRAKNRGMGARLGHEIAGVACVFDMLLPESQCSLSLAV